MNNILKNFLDWEFTDMIYIKAQILDYLLKLTIVC
jgi:hypothetical protein